MIVYLPLSNGIICTIEKRIFDFVLTWNLNLETMHRQCSRCKKEIIPSKGMKLFHPKGLKNLLNSRVYCSDECVEKAESKKWYE